MSSTLCTTTFGEASDSTVVLLHGFTQTSACWGPIADALASSHLVHAIDLPGHGESHAISADLPHTADLIASTIVELGAIDATVVGYSLGGRVALHLALEHPEVLSRAVLIGATGGIEDESERIQRRDADDRLADHLERIGVPAFIDEWLAQPLFETLQREQGCRDDRLRNTESGLASSLRSSGTGTQTPLWPLLSRLEMPVLVVAGENDSKFTELGHRLVECIGANASFVAIERAGHSAHLEQPDITFTAIESWIASHRY